MATALVRRRVERLIALADVVRASSGLTASRAAIAAGWPGQSRRWAFRWMTRLQAIGVVRRIGGDTRSTRWVVTALGRDRRKTLMRIGESGALAAVPHGASATGSRRAARSDGEAMSRIVVDRALTGQPAMFMVSNGAGDPLADDADEW